MEKMGGREAGEEAAVELNKEEAWTRQGSGMDTALKDRHYPPDGLVVVVI